MLEMRYTTLEETAQEIVISAVNDYEWNDAANTNGMKDGSDWQMMARNAILWYLTTYRYLTADCAYGVYSHFLPQVLRELVEEGLREHYEGE